MKRIQLIGLFAAATFIFCSASAASAHAEEPYFEIKHKRLGPTETIGLGFTNTILNYVLKLGSVTVTCKLVTLKAGATLIGSEAGGPAATNKETVEYKECTQTNNGLLCSVENEKFTSVPLKSTLVVDDSQKFIYVHLQDELLEGAYAIVNFTGVCNQTKITITGTTVCEYFIGGKVVEVGKEPAESIHPEFNFPTTQIALVLLNGTDTLTGLKVGGEPVSQEGRSETEVTGAEEWGAYT